MLGNTLLFYGCLKSTLKKSRKTIYNPKWKCVVITSNMDKKLNSKHPKSVTTVTITSQVAETSWNPEHYIVMILTHLLRRLVSKWCYLLDYSWPKGKKEEFFFLSEDLCVAMARDRIWGAVWPFFRLTGLKRRPNWV